MRTGSNLDSNGLRKFNAAMPSADHRCCQCRLYGRGFCIPGHLSEKQGKRSARHWHRARSSSGSAIRSHRNPRSHYGMIAFKFMDFTVGVVGHYRSMFRILSARPLPVNGDQRAPTLEAAIMIWPVRASSRHWHRRAEERTALPRWCGTFIRRYRCGFSSLCLPWLDLRRDCRLTAGGPSWACCFQISALY